MPRPPPPPRGGAHATSRVPLLLLLSCCALACAREDTAERGAADASGAPASAGSVTLYSGRAEALVGPLLERFEHETGIDVQVRYAGTPELAATLLEEGETNT